MHQQYMIKTIQPNCLKIYYLTIIFKHPQSLCAFITFYCSFHFWFGSTFFRFSFFCANFSFFSLFFVYLFVHFLLTSAYLWLFHLLSAFSANFTFCVYIRFFLLISAFCAIFQLLLCSFHLFYSLSANLGCLRNFISFNFLLI